MFRKISCLMPYFYVNAVRFFRLTELYQPTYNPRGWFFLRSRESLRPCEDRIEAIQENINFTGIASYLDIGSQAGYFVFRLTEENKLKWAYGIEKDPVACHYANSLSYLWALKNISFMCSEIDGNSVLALPNCDVISLLNVFHHLVYFKGFSSTDAIMRTLVKKCNANFIFETAYPTEKGFYWSDCLEFMGNDPELWIKQYLLGIGFKKVKIAGKFSTHLTGQQRALFICEK